MCGDECGVVAVFYDKFCENKRGFHDVFSVWPRFFFVPEQGIQHKSKLFWTVFNPHDYKKINFPWV